MVGGYVGGGPGGFTLRVYAKPNYKNEFCSLTMSLIQSLNRTSHSRGKISIY